MNPTANHSRPGTSHKHLNFMRPFRLLVLALALIVGGFFVWNWLSFQRVRRGYEVDPTTHSSYLQTRLAEDLGYSGFEAVWLQRAWVNGFSDHTYLFVAAADSTDLRQAIEVVAGTEPISASYFRDGAYLGPSTTPSWWDTATIDSAEARYFRKESRLWRFTWIGSRLYIVLSVA